MHKKYHLASIRRKHSLVASGNAEFWSTLVPLLDLVVSSLVETIEALLLVSARALRGRLLRSPRLGRLDARHFKLESLAYGKARQGSSGLAGT